MYLFSSFHYIKHRHCVQKDFTVQIRTIKDTGKSKFVCHEEETICIPIIPKKEADLPKFFGQKHIDGPKSQTDGQKIIHKPIIKTLKEMMTCSSLVLDGTAVNYELKTLNDTILCK